MKKTDEDEPQEHETRFGSLVPWGGGGPGVDWDEVNRRAKEEDEDGNDSK